MVDTRNVSASFELGRDAGTVGRWVRLIVGVLGLGFITWDVLKDSPPASLYVYMLVSVVAITGIYTLAYYFFGEKYLSRLNPWLNTLLLLGPTALVLPLGLGPDSFQAGLFTYVSASLVANFVMSYGGCEVVAIPSLILGHRYTVYCPWNALDAVERAAVGRNRESERGRRAMIE